MAMTTRITILRHVTILSSFISHTRINESRVGANQITTEFVSSIRYDWKYSRTTFQNKHSFQLLPL
jgi:hypothetical protein